MKNQKGITLIALIITIIVMLILVSVTVSVLINSNLIGNAKDAADKHNTATKIEGDIVNSVTVRVDDQNKAVGEYINSLIPTT